MKGTSLLIVPRTAPQNPLCCSAIPVGSDKVTPLAFDRGLFHATVTHAILSPLVYQPTSKHRRCLAAAAVGVHGWHWSTCAKILLIHVSRLKYFIYPQNHLAFLNPPMLSRCYLSLILPFFILSFSLDILLLSLYFCYHLILGGLGSW